MRKYIVIGILVLIIGSSSISVGKNETQITTIKPQYRGNTLYVGGSGQNNYTRIQDAIDNASQGDTVFVYDDSAPYNEIITIEKSISMTGEEKETTIIDSMQSDTSITIDSDNVTISGFTIKNPKPERYIILAHHVKNINIENNILIINEQEAISYSSNREE